MTSTTTYRFDAATRSEDRVADIRKQGFIPVVLYGNKKPAEHLQIKATVFDKVFHKAGESSLIELFVDGQSQGNVLVKDIQYEPVKHTIIHADLYRVDMAQKVTTDIPLVFVGVAPAVKELNGILVTQLDKIEVECLPQDLVSEIEVDISGLKEFTDSILIKDIVLPSGIESLQDETISVISISEPRKAEEEKSDEATSDAVKPEEVNEEEPKESKE